MQQIYLVFSVVERRDEGNEYGPPREEEQFVRAFDYRRSAEDFVGVVLEGKAQGHTDRWTGVTTYTMIEPGRGLKTLARIRPTTLYLGEE